MTKIEKIVKIINDLLKGGCDKFEPEVCDACKKARNKIKEIIYAKNLSVLR